MLRYAELFPLCRLALAKYIPCLAFLLCINPHELRSTSSSFMSMRRSTVTSQTSDTSGQFRRQSKSRLSSASDSESVSCRSPWSQRSCGDKIKTNALPVALQCLTDTEAELSSIGSRPASRQVSCDISRDTAELPGYKPAASFKSKVKSPDSGVFEKVRLVTISFM